MGFYLCRPMCWLAAAPVGMKNRDRHRSPPPPDTGLILGKTGRWAAWGIIFLSSHSFGADLDSNPGCKELLIDSVPLRACYHTGDCNFHGWSIIPPPPKKKKKAGTVLQRRNDS